jgi:aminopeptidase N
VVTAGPWRKLADTTALSGNLPIAVYARQARASEYRQGGEIARLVKRSIGCLERELGLSYPYEKCDAVFVPEFPSLASSVPGVVMFHDKVFDLAASREPRYAATVISHEVAHAWIGSLVDCDEAWVVEALTTYLSRTIVDEWDPGYRPWSARTAPMPDAAYERDAELIRKLETKIGRPAVLRGLRIFLHQYSHRISGLAELAHCWSQASGQDLVGWVTTNIRSSGE